MLLKLYYLIILLYLLCFAFRIAGRKSLEFASGLFALIINGTLLISIWIQSGHLPLFNFFESFLFMTFILGLLGLFLKGPRDYSDKVRVWVWLEVLILLAVSLFFPKETAFPMYNYGYILIILFYIFRYISLPLMLYSSAYYIQFIIQREKNERTRLLSQQGRNFLLLSAGLFLISEYVGIVWCQKGWGDFWMWGLNFLQSIFIVLFLMLAFHIPGKGKFSEDIKAVIGGLTGFAVLTLYIVRGLLG
jgi:hypothetical protein